MWKKKLRQLALPESYISITLGFLVVIVAGLLAFNYLSKNRTVKTASNQMQPAKQTQPLKKDEAVTGATLPTTHTVSDNESLWTISEKYYGSGYNWVNIAKDNQLTDPNHLTVGEKLNIPVAETIKPSSGQVSSTSIEPEKSYTVVRGDNLWNIAVKEYGNGFEWVKIANANRLANPRIIHAGNRFVLPR